MNNYNADFLTRAENLSLQLRVLYSRFGYKQYRMSKFEEYDLYSENRDFLVSEGVITFTDTNGHLMALKPDVTLSIIKNIRPQAGEIRKLYYDENVYRVTKRTGSYGEIMQTGLECLGAVDSETVYEVLRLALESLKIAAPDYIMDVSHTGLISAVINRITDDEAVKASLIQCLTEKNLNGIDSVACDNGLDGDGIKCLKKLVSVSGTPSDVLPEIKEIADELGAESVWAEISETLGKFGKDSKVNIDFSVSGDMKYYNGIVFKGFIPGIPESVLSGGRYDRLLKKMGRQGGAIGFAVYLDLLEREKSPIEKTMLNVALPKGRLGESVYEMMEKAGFPCPSIKDPGRKLIFENEEAGVRYFWVKPSDVAIYVERGAADIGIAGKDILLEYEPDVYEMLDLNIGKCRMAVAAPRDFEDDNRYTLRVATKFANIAKKYYAGTGRDIDIIHLNGSIELAPILGLSDVIVDIVETGKTLKENNLEVFETIVPISARLIANKSGYKFKSEAIRKVVSGLKKITEEVQ